MFYYEFVDKTCMLFFGVFAKVIDTFYALFNIYDF